MSIESIESIARSFDNELKQFELQTGLIDFGSSSLCDSPVDTHMLPEHSLELAAAESEREKLYDKLHDLTARVEELEAHNRHQETLLIQMNRKNRQLEEKVRSLDENEISESSVFDDNIAELLRAKNKALDLELNEARALLMQSMKSCRDAITAKKTADNEREAEMKRRLLAEKQRDAYAAAYQQALSHIEKWSK
jgi:hypothetical protein